MFIHLGKTTAPDAVEEVRPSGLCGAHLSTNGTNRLHPGEFLSSDTGRAQRRDLTGHSDDVSSKRFFPPQLPLTYQVFRL